MLNIALVKVRFLWTVIGARPIWLAMLFMVKTEGMVARDYRLMMTRFSSFSWMLAFLSFSLFAQGVWLAVNTIVLKMVLVLDPKSMWTLLFLCVSVAGLLLSRRAMLTRLSRWAIRLCTLALKLCSIPLLWRIRAAV